MHDGHVFRLTEVILQVVEFPTLGLVEVDGLPITQPNAAMRFVSRTARAPDVRIMKEKRPDDFWRLAGDIVSQVSAVDIFSSCQPVTDAGPVTEGRIVVFANVRCVTDGGSRNRNLLLSTGVSDTPLKLSGGSP